MPIHPSPMSPMRSRKPDGRGYRSIELESDVRYRPTEATHKILTAVREAGANVRAAAELLGLSERTLYRYVDKLGITKLIDDMRQRAIREGWHHKGRWQRKEES